MKLNIDLLQFEITIKKNETSDKYYYMAFGQFDGRIWINNSEGEGMTVEMNELYKIIDAYFKENH